MFGADARAEGNSALPEGDAEGFVFQNAQLGDDQLLPLLQPDKPTTVNTTNRQEIAEIRMTCMSFETDEKRGWPRVAVDILVNGRRGRPLP